MSRTAVVTGATDGIGKETAFELAKRGFRVLVHGRNEAKAEAAAKEIASRVKDARVEPVYGNLGSLAEVRALAAQISEKAPSLDVLVNNAGVFAKERSLTVDGFELSMGVNHFAPFLLSLLVLPAMRAPGDARIVNVSSVAHNRGRIPFDDLTFERSFDGYAAYAASKLANVLFTHALARRLVGTSITTNALHPGVITTKLLKTGFGVDGASLEQGAATSVKLASDPSLAKTSGKYFSDEREATSSKASHDQNDEERLWDLSVSLTGAPSLEKLL